MSVHFLFVSSESVINFLNYFPLLNEQTIQTFVCFNNRTFKCGKCSLSQHYYVCKLLKLATNIVWLVIFMGLIFRGLGSSGNFVGLYFRGIPPLIT